MLPIQKQNADDSGHPNIDPETVANTEVDDVGLLQRDHLGRKIAWRAHNWVASVALVLLKYARTSKIANLNTAFAVDEQIWRFEVSVDNILFVQVFNAGQNLPHYETDLRLGKVLASLQHVS